MARQLKKIINVTQHTPTPEQKNAGVFDPPEDVKERIKELLTFNVLPSYDNMVGRALKIAQLIKPYHPDAALIGGAPYFMSVLENTLTAYGIEPVYAFSKRESVEIQKEDGTVEKRNVFRHVGFVRPLIEMFNPEEK